MTLPDSLMSALEILEFVIPADCYPNVSVAHDCNFGGKKFLKIEVVEELFEINYVTRKVKWIGYLHHRERYLGHY